MGNTFILVYSLPVNSEEDCVHEREREKIRDGKGEKRWKMSLQCINLEKRSQWYHRCQICARKWWESKDQRNENVL